MPRVLDRPYEGLQFIVDVITWGSVAAVPGKLQIYRRGEGILDRRGEAQEVVRLLVARRTEREEVVGASLKAGFTCATPVGFVAVIDEVATLRSFDVNERNIVSSNRIPVNFSLAEISIP